MPKTFLEPDATFRLHAPPEGVRMTMLGETEVAMAQAMPWPWCRYNDPEMEREFPLNVGRDARPYFDREWAPFLGWQEHDVGAVQKSFRYGISPMVRFAQYAEGVPFLFALIADPTWSETHVLDVVRHATGHADFADALWQGRTLLDHALDQGRLRLADGLWAQGIRFGQRAKMDGGPVWDALLCSFAHWAMAVEFKGCSTPQTAAKTFDKLSEQEVHRIASQFSPMLLQWIDRACKSRVNVNVPRNVWFEDVIEGSQKKKERTLDTSAMGLVLFQLGRNVFDPKDRPRVARILVDRLLQAGALAQTPMVFDGKLPGVGMADYAKEKGLAEAATLIEQVALHETLTAMVTDNEGDGTQRDEAPPPVVRRRL